MYWVGGVNKDYLPSVYCILVVIRGRFVPVRGTLLFEDLTNEQLAAWEVLQVFCSTVVTYKHPLYIDHGLADII